jgi:type IV fimbrial biogenesis protein FimT
MRRPSLGLTLVELLVVLAIAATLVGLMLPAMETYVTREHAAAALNQLIGAVQFARTAAITMRRTVTLCPAQDAQMCGPRDTWHSGAVIFVDSDRNGRRDDDETVLRTLPALPPGSRVYWRSFRNRAYLSFTPTGLTAWQNGSFRYCPPSEDPTLIREVIINPQGRLRRATDQDGDGVVEDATGKPVSCP